tara:strand:+ start:3568 stop:4281 length:714 start_codon:yes stop_codon:yes gene_type:complete
MAGDWIKMRTNLDTDPAVVRISSGLKTDRFSVVGRLHKIWSWANEHLTDGQDVPIDSEFLDALVETPGFSEQLRRVGWLSGRDGMLNFPSFDRHNGVSAKSRAMDASRKKDVRKMSGSKPDKNRTREEKSREEKNTHTPSQHLKSEKFVSAWDCWKNKQAVSSGVMMDAMTEEAQLYQLENFDTEEAIVVVQFSTSRTNCKNLLVRGEHKQPEPEHRNGRYNGKKQVDLTLPIEDGS